MRINQERIKREKLEELISAGALREIFIKHLHWDKYEGRMGDVMVKFAGEEYKFSVVGVAEKRGFTICHARCEEMPKRSVRQKLEANLLKAHYEHLLVLEDGEGMQRWIYTISKPGMPARFVEISAHPVSFLVDKLRGFVFGINEEDELTITEVFGRVDAAFTQNIEKITYRFYDRFREELQKFSEFIKGIKELVDKEHYGSLMLNRLMFVYFIQKKGYLDGDEDYLRKRLKTVQDKYGKDKFYGNFYRHFLKILFHQGLGAPQEKRNPEVNELIGEVPYLNGGLFDEHRIELGNDDIRIPDKVFESIFKFFDDFQWVLDDRPNASGEDINPDVIGYIFEKYINDRAAMGAYYTKEDITGYIARNTILPALLQKAKEQCKEAFDQQSGTIWKLLRDNPDDYFYESARKGCDKPDDDLPKNIQHGLDSAAPGLLCRRADWNKEADEEFAVSGETWRETIARRRRYFAVKDKIKNGGITDIADLTTHNLNIVQLTTDAIAEHEGTDFLSAFYFAIAGRKPTEGKNINERRGLTILDPACGSGAFLFAALNVLHSLYEDCLDRMDKFVKDENILLKSDPSRRRRLDEYRDILDEVSKHPKDYWICRNIILHNLFGVDLMPDAAEVAKLRLFLKLAAVSVVDNTKPNMGLEPLPDIDFNVRAGNSLVGFSSMVEFEKVANKELDLSGGLIGDIRNEAETVGMAYRGFVDEQAVSDIGGESFRTAKKILNKRLKALNEKLDEYLYGIKRSEDEEKWTARFVEWKKTHRPFHWFAEFYDIIENGGFDVVIGNPPYLEKRAIGYEVQNYETGRSNAVHCFFMERGHSLLKADGHMGNIVPMALTCTQRMATMQKILESRHKVWYSNFSWRPDKFFETVNRALTIFICAPKKQNSGEVYSTHYIRWASENREYVFGKLHYILTPQKRVFHWVPKINDAIELSILSKLTGARYFVKNFVGGSQHKIHYRHTGGLYWKIFIDFPPRFYVNGNLGISNTDTDFFVAKKEHILPLIASLSSDVFWWHYTVTANLRDLPPHDIYHFPITENILNDPALSDLGARYLNDIRENSEMRTRRQQTTGETKSQHFIISKSKSIIDEIDKILAKHYGFTEEELDYIINYDYKYRMSRAE